MQGRLLIKLIALLIIVMAGQSPGFAEQTRTVDSFASEAMSGVDQDGSGVGFVVWHDGSGELVLETVQVEPGDELALPGQDAAQHVLVVDHRIADWGGFTHAFTDETLSSWQYRDWSAYDDIRFWFKGSGTNEEIQFDLFDNRNPNMRGDSAERFYYRFTDDTTSWRQIEIPLDALQRRTDWQPAGAPDDGLTLTQVWGYAFGFPPGDAQSVIADVVLYGTDVQATERIEVAFSQPSFTVTQGETARVTAVLNAPHDEEVTIAYRLEPQTALLERDLSAAEGQLTFAPGETEQVFTVETSNSDRYTGDLTADLVLEAPQNAHLGFQHRATLVLVDPDAPDAALLDDFERGQVQVQPVGPVTLNPLDIGASEPLARPGQAATEGVLELQLEGHPEPSGLIRQYDTPQDWQAFEGITFWYHGSGTGDEVTLELHSTRAPEVESDTWELVWSDEFDGPAGTLPDPATWTPEVGDGTTQGIPGWGNAERQYYTNDPRNVSLDGEGNLSITARSLQEEDQDEGLECYYGPCEYTSARLITWGALEVEYGRVEARIKLPEGQGIWPAFWMLGTNLDEVGWPQSGEIDIMENVGREPDVVHGTVHGPGYSGAQGIGGSHPHPTGDPFAADYHLYAVEWEPGEIRWFVDDTHYFTLTPDDLPAQAEWVFDHPFFMVLNLAVGGNWPGYPDDTTRFPQEMLVDYVRVYGTPDTSARFSASFTDSTPGWQQVILPFAAFTRSAQQPVNAPEGDLDLSEVWAYRFTWPEGTAGTVYIDHVRLAAAQSADAPYMDKTLSTEERVEDLLARMTLEEKIGQMTQVNVSRLMGSGEWDRGPLNEAWLQTVLAEHHVGSLLSGGGASPLPNTPTGWARMTNDLQRFAIENSRLGIPIVYGIDAVHGHNNVVGATIYPHNIGLAASWNPDLVERIAEHTARDVRATGIHWNFAPVADLGRDARWGRFYETFGEDPYLASELVAASVRGFEGDDLTEGVAATIKHFVGYGAPLTGQDRTPALIPLRTLRELHLIPAEAGFDAGARTVMVNSGSVNGIPVHASRYLLTDLLRDELGFEGVVVSDWNDIDKLVNHHRTAATYSHAVAMSINAGVDMYMVPHDSATFTHTLHALAQEGRVSQERIDEAVRRILTLKFDLGLFEDPYVDEAMAGDLVEEERSLAYEAAVSSLTLLDNPNILPLDGVQRVVVTGPGADSIIAPMGGWTIGWQGVESPTEVPPGVTVLEGLRARAPEGVTVEHARGNAPEQLSAALEEADVAVVVLSEPPYAEMQGDSATLRLAADQEEHVRLVLASGKPTVLILFAGRPVLLPDDVLRARKAFIMAYLPGSEAGSAIADVIFGNANPGGRLPFTWPRNTGQLPLTYDVPATEVAAHEALYPFGHGLSYTRFQHAELSADVTDDQVDVTVTVSNTGEREGTETIMVFAQRPPSGVLTPMRQLVGFAQVTLAPGESEEVILTIPTSRFAIVTGDILGDGERQVVPGMYRLFVGRLQAQLELAGDGPAVQTAP